MKAIKRIILYCLMLLSLPMQAQRLGDYTAKLDSLLKHPGQFEPLPRCDNAFWHDSLPLEMRSSYIEYGEHELGKPWPTLPYSVFAQFKTNGNRVNYEALCFEKRRHLAVLVMAELCEGRGRFVPDIVDGLGAFCEETWWGIPAHYKTKIPRAEDQTVDLFNAETASLVAWTTYVMRPQLDAFAPQLSKRIADELHRRILEPARLQKYWWKTAGMNWNPWICSNWLACTLLFETDRERQLDAVTQIMKATDAFIDSYKSDGGCDEGPGYWDRAAASMFEVLSLLRQATDGYVDLSGNEKIQAMGSYVYKTYIGNGYCTTFADTHSNLAVGEPNILYSFGCYLDDRLMKGYAAYAAQRHDYIAKAGQLFSESPNFPSLARELPFLLKIHGFIAEKPREPLLKDVWLPDLQVFTARRSPFFVAVKGGNNGESHNHNDVGEFIVYANPSPHSPQGGDGNLLPLLIDPGVGEYTAQTFSGGRYGIWTMQSQYHNLPQVNGTDQKDGKDYCVKVVAQKKGKVTLELAGAYPPEAAVRSWQRTVTTDSKAISMTENYNLSDYHSPTRIMLLTVEEPMVEKPGRIKLGHGYTLTYDARQLEPAVENINAKLDPVLQGMWGQHLYRIILTIRQQSLNGHITYRISY